MNERLLSNTLTDSNADAFQVWQVTVTPANISLSVTACGRNCTVIVVLEVGNNGQIQVTHVQVQGMLALIMSDDELTKALNSNAQNFSPHIIYRVTKMTLLEHAIDVQLH